MAYLYRYRTLSHLPALPALPGAPRHLPGPSRRARAPASKARALRRARAPDLAGASWGEQVGVLVPCLAPSNLHGFAQNKVRWARDCEANNSRTKRWWRANISRYGVAGGRMQGYLPTLYLPQFSIKSHNPKCIVYALLVRFHCNTCAKHARIFRDGVYLP